MKHNSYVVLCLTMICSIICAQDPVAQELLKPTTDIRIVSYNIRRKGSEGDETRLWKYRSSLVIKLLKELRPEIFGIQEATLDQMEEIQRSFPEYGSFGEGRGATWRGWGANEYTPLFYKSSKYIVLESGTFWINERSILFWRSGWLPRICTWGKFEDRQTGKQFYVFNTHLDNMFETAQKNGLKAIQKMIDEKRDAPIILLGDFNSPFIEDLQKIIPSFMHAKVKARIKRGPEQTHTGWTGADLKEIDHIVINDPSAIVKEYAIVDRPGTIASDHRPVFASILL